MAGSLSDRLRIKAGMRVLLLNPFPGFSDLLDPSAAGFSVDTAPVGQYDCVVLFVRSRAEADQHSPTAASAVKPGGLLWTCYPKLTSKLKGDITRDQGWDALIGAGWAGIAMISIDDTWSAMRWRPAESVKRKSNA